MPKRGGAAPFTRARGMAIVGAGIGAESARHDDEGRETKCTEIRSVAIYAGRLSRTGTTEK